MKTGRDNSVGIATGYGAGQPRLESRRGHEIFLYFTAFRPVPRFLFSNGSTALCGPWPLFQFPNLHTVGRTPWTSDQPVVRPLLIHRTTQTQNKHIHKHPCLE
jgi:hypothetical protein